MRRRGRRHYRNGTAQRVSPRVFLVVLAIVLVIFLAVLALIFFVASSGGFI